MRLRPVDPERGGALRRRPSGPPAPPRPSPARQPARMVSRSVPAEQLLTVIDHAWPPLLVEGAPIEQWSAEPVFVKSPAVSPETGLSNRDHHVNDDARVGPLGATIATRGAVPARAVSEQRRDEVDVAGRRVVGPAGAGDAQEPLAIAVRVRTAGGARVPLEAGVRPAEHDDRERGDTGRGDGRRVEDDVDGGRAAAVGRDRPTCSSSSRRARRPSSRPGSPTGHPTARSGSRPGRCRVSPLARRCISRATETIGLADVEGLRHRRRGPARAVLVVDQDRERGRPRAARHDRQQHRRGHQARQRASPAVPRACRHVSLQCGPAFPA